MSFHESACDIHLSPEPGARRTSLVAICNNEDGSGMESDIVLDDFLGNYDGHFIWGGKNVTETCRNMEIKREGPHRVPVLHAELRNNAGEFHPASCHLDEHICNIHGHLLFRP